MEKTEPEVGIKDVIKIIVLMKRVPDIERAIDLNPDGTIDRGKTSVANPYDLNALEAALELKDKRNGNAEITVISMGRPQAAEVVIKGEAIFMGADNGILISDPKLAGSDTLVTAYVLSCAIKRKGDWDLILCGTETIDSSTGHVGTQVAERLGIPSIAHVESFEIEDKKIKAKRLIEGGYQVLETNLPALLTITNTANQPRYPGKPILSEMRASGKNIPVWTVEDIGAEESRVGLGGSPTKIEKIERAKQRIGGCVMFREQDLKEFLERLKKDGVKLKRRGRVK